MLVLFFGLSLGFAQENNACTSDAASAAFVQGFTAQKEGKNTTAIAEYTKCLQIEPNCLKCHYEIGWSYWSQSNWTEVKKHWEKVVKMEPQNQEYADLLNQANEKASPTTSTSQLRIPFGVSSTKNNVTMTMVARFQNYQSNTTNPNDHHDEMVYSPKSARFSEDGKKVYVNSLEGTRTVIYNTETLQRIGSIEHRFNKDTEDLFFGENTVFGYTYNKKSKSGNPNHFMGKPVESALSHNGKYLWVPYYRRDFDTGATSPSAVSIIDTTTDTIVRVMPTGPIPKYVAISPDNKWAIITHWGDNTLGVIDISSGDPKTFKYLEKRLVIERALSQTGLSGTDRDSTCGFCLRGTVFTPDSKTLLVARMGGGGVAGFDVDTWTYLGTLYGEKPTPRHLVISNDYLYMSSNKSGYVSKTSLPNFINSLRAAEGKKVKYTDWQTTFVGSGARTIDMSEDGTRLFVAVNNSAKLVVLDPIKMEVLNSIPTDSYTVGLAVSKDGKQVWTTSQGKKNGGGNSVCVYEIK